MKGQKQFVWFVHNKNQTKEKIIKGPENYRQFEIFYNGLTGVNEESDHFAQEISWLLLKILLDILMGSQFIAIL